MTDDESSEGELPSLSGRSKFMALKTKDTQQEARSLHVELLICEKEQKEKTWKLSEMKRKKGKLKTNRNKTVESTKWVNKIRTDIAIILHPELNM